jgi:hypothetical protein
MNRLFDLVEEKRSTTTRAWKNSQKCKGTCKDKEKKSRRRSNCSKGAKTDSRWYVECAAANARTQSGSNENRRVANNNNRERRGNEKPHHFLLT